MFFFVCCQAYSAALQTQWQWVNQLCLCVEEHLKDNSAYFQVKYVNNLHQNCFSNQLKSQLVNLSIYFPNFYVGCNSEGFVTFSFY